MAAGCDHFGGDWRNPAFASAEVEETAEAHVFGDVVISSVSTGLKPSKGTQMRCDRFVVSLLRRLTIGGRNPAIHRNVRPSHEAGIVTGEECDDGRNFVRLAYPPERNSLREFSK